MRLEMNSTLRRVALMVSWPFKRDYKTSYLMPGKSFSPADWWNACKSTWYKTSYDGPLTMDSVLGASAEYFRYCLHHHDIQTFKSFDVDWRIWGEYHPPIFTHAFSIPRRFWALCVAHLRGPESLGFTVAQTILIKMCRRPLYRDASRKLQGDLFWQKDSPGLRRRKN